MHDARSTQRRCIVLSGVERKVHVGYWGNTSLINNLHTSSLFVWWFDIHLGIRGFFNETMERTFTDLTTPSIGP